MGLGSGGRAATAGEAAPALPPHMARIDYLDGWRGISILLVLAGHFFLLRSWWVAPCGVECFFVLSGRLMADILFVERFPLAEFYKRRVSRVFPGLVVFALAAFLALRGTDLAFKPQALVPALTFTLNYALVFTHRVPAIENLWSLCVEEHGYLLLGVLALLARRRRFDPGVALLALAGLSMADAVVSDTVLGQDYFTAYWRSDAHLGSIFVAAGARLVLRERKLPAWLPLAALASGLAVLALTPYWVRYSLGTSLLAVGVASLDAAPAAAQRALAWRPLRQAGLWSYSLYLYQQPWFQASRAAALEPGQVPRGLPAAAALAGALVCGVASFYLVEQPARRWINARWRFGAKTGAPPAAATVSASPTRSAG